MDLKQDTNCNSVSTDSKLLEILKRISKKGNNAEVKQNRDGTWTVYEVKKQKTLVM